VLSAVFFYKRVEQHREYEAERKVQLAHFLIIENKTDSSPAGEPEGNAASDINLKKGPKYAEKKDSTGRSSMENTYPRVTDRLF
jgi:hypothetical protein